MQISKNAVVGFDYTLCDSQGQVLDSSEGKQPLHYLHGAGAIIPGLERELEGKQVGDELKVQVQPQDGYGERQDALRQQVPREQFKDIGELQLGMQFRVPADNGHVVVTVVEISDDTVTVDGNHPLAGVELHFDITVREVRPATESELEHGHAHGPGGHEH